MPLYNFLDEFADEVEAGRKKQTIRRPRQDRPTVKGDKLYLVNGLRIRKPVRRLLTTTCQDVKPIEMYDAWLELDGEALTYRQTEAFAKADGFPSVERFFEFFREKYGLSNVKPLILEVIYWL